MEVVKADASSPSLPSHRRATMEESRLRVANSQRRAEAVMEGAGGPWRGPSTGPGSGFHAPAHAKVSFMMGSSIWQ